MWDLIQYGLVSIYHPYMVTFQDTENFELIVYMICS